MALEGKNYVPTLAIRASEMNGLQFLPAATKDRITPCILLAPWANAASLEKSLERVRKAFWGRSYFLDIDRDYELTNVESLPQQRLVELLNPADAFRSWCEFISENEGVMPCVQTRGQSEAEIRTQIEWYQACGRAYAMRIHMSRIPQNIEEVVSAFAASGTADYTIILEGGWTRDPLSLAAWFDGLIGGPLAQIDASVPIVLSCTSMPKLFVSFHGGITKVPFSNHELVDQIRRRRSNRTRIVYGDWGSTRPREPKEFAGRPVDRIDYPTEVAWSIARNREEEWDFRRAAEAIVRSQEWVGNLGIWGEEMIWNTSINEEIGIDTPQKNVAARVNIHLHRQAFFGFSDLGGMNLDEDWED